jgi:hypothetical protein
LIISLYLYQFSIRDLYSPGYQLNEAEAQALNALRAENVRKIGYREFDKRGFKKEMLLSTEEVEKITEDLARIDSNYQFELRPPVTPKPGTLEAEIRAVAEEQAELEFRRTDRLIGGTKFREEIKKNESLPENQAEARRRLEKKMQVAREALQELLR